MKKIIFFSILLLSMAATITVASPTNQSKLDHIDPSLSTTYSVNSVEDFLELTPKKYKEMTGKKMKVKEIIGLKIAQAKIKKAIDYPNSPGSNNDGLRILAYIFAVLLSPVGVLLVDGVSGKFILNCLLWLVCGVAGLFLPCIGLLLFLIPIAHAVMVVAKHYGDL